MTRDNEMAKKVAELNTLFLMLNEKGQDNALNILRALEFAQSVMSEPDRMLSQQAVSQNRKRNV
jgi:hypothetical protein